MATQQILQVQGTQLLFADATDFPNSGGGPPTTAANNLIIGTPTKVQIDLTNVSAAAMRQSAKTADLGAAWAVEWLFQACIEHESAPTAGGTVDFYWNASPNSTAATGNTGGASGSDAAYTAAGLDQMIKIGALYLRNTVINIGTVGTIWVPHRYGSLVVVNNGSTGLRTSATAMDETHITATPVVKDIQAAA